MYHTVIIVGNLGKDPEMRYTPSGTPVTNFNLATSRKWLDANGQQVNETIWFRISVWGKQAESCNQYLKKGSRVLVEGALVPDRSTGGPRIYQRQDGSSGANFEIRASTIRFLSGRENDNGAPADPAPVTTAAEEELPF